MNLIKDNDLRLALKLLTFTSFIFPTIMSGNFDSTISRYIILLALSGTLIAAIKLIGDQRVNNHRNSQVIDKEE
jgi:hypothetical protein